MSTKCTIAYSNDPETDYHFYNECFDDDAVYLELVGECAREFEAGPRRVMVRIPLEIWAVIREHAPVQTTYAGLTDEQLEAIVQREVARPGFQAWADFVCPNMTPEELLEDRREHYRFLRDRDDALRAKIEQLQKKTARRSTDQEEEDDE